MRGEHRGPLPDHGLVYIPIPKNACSTLKHACYEIRYGRVFGAEEKRAKGHRDIHEFFLSLPEAWTGVEELHLDEVIPIEGLDALSERLREMRPGLEFRREKSGGTRVGLGELSRDAFEHAVQFCRPDYELLGGFYSPEAITEAYARSRG